MARRLNTIILTDSFDNEVCKAEVVDSEVVHCFNKFAVEAQRFGAPCIYVNGKGYTNRADFMKMIHTVNEFSTFHGGTQVY